MTRVKLAVRTRLESEFDDGERSALRPVLELLESLDGAARSPFAV